jgi:hypothetical protein
MSYPVFGLNLRRKMNPDNAELRNEKEGDSSAI